MEIYGDEAHGGMIKHVTYPDSFMWEMETTISQLVGLADDPMMKAIIASMQCLVPQRLTGGSRKKAGHYVFGR